MVQIAGKYKFAKNENFAEHLTALGVPEEHVKAAVNRTPTIDVKVDGNKITVVSDGGVPVTYILDQEIEETAFTGGQVLKSVAKLNGDTLTITSKHGGATQGGTTRVHKFSDSGFVMTLINDDPKVPQATRTYERI